MPIPFRDEEQTEKLGTAAYLKIISSPNGHVYEGALFLIKAQGEPLEFTYNRINMPYSFLWRREDIRRHAVKKLTASLLDLCPHTPRLIFCLSEEVASELFCQDIRVSIPVCRISSALGKCTDTEIEQIETISGSESINLFWFPSKPDTASLEYSILKELTGRGLLLEPFERAATGLREIYGANS